MKKYILISILGLALVGFVSRMPSPKPSVQVVPLKYAGFQTFPSPLTGMQPGFIFRVPKNSSSDQVPVDIIGQSQLYNVSSRTVADITQHWKTNILLSFIAAKILGIKANFSRDFQVTVAFKGGTNEVLLERTIDSLLEKRPIKFLPDNDYYVINQTISFDGLDYKMIVSKDMGADVENYIDTLVVHGHLTVDHSRNDTTKLVQDFKEPHRLFYTVLKVTPRGTQLGNGNKYGFSKVIIPLADPGLYKEKSTGQ
jgi:hypothetical protein